jgi:RNA polymerase sigma-32 factor
MAENKEKTEQKAKTANLPALTTSLERYLIEISNHPVLSREEEYKLAVKYRDDGDLDAAKKLVSSNLKFVVKIANEYKNYGINMMDVIQEGNIGLMNAVKGFDPTKGYRLISYAVWWIRAYIQNYLMKSWSLVKVGTNQAQRKLFYKLRSAKNSLGKEGDFISEEDYSRIAKELGVRNKDVIEMDQRMSKKDFSLDSKIGESQDNTYISLLEDKRFNQEDIVAKSQLENSIKDNIGPILESLKDRERYIIEERILTDTPQTLDEIGKKYEISRERVRQIENSALKKIKKAFKEKGIEKINF